MNPTNPEVDWYFEKATKWQAEIIKLRQILLDGELAEELKWGVPCYTLNGANIVLIHAFKEYCAILFFKGALLKDPENILIQQTENVQAARQIRFTSIELVLKLQPTVQAYVQEAIQIEKSGLKVELKPTREFVIPDEFQKALNESSGLKEAFEALTPGRQRGYILYFSAAKQSKTRESRIEKCIPKIFDGMGLDD